MSDDNTTTSTTPDAVDEAMQQQAGEETFFRKQLKKDVWEAWAWMGVGLFASAVVIWIVAFAKLGMISVKAYGVGIPLTSMMAVPIMLWGLMKSLFNPPIFRRSRSIAFILVGVVSFFANRPLVSAPVSTEGWTTDQEYRLPFEGTWYTLTGGDSMDTNYLATSPSMRWGYEFTVLRDGKRAPANAAKTSEYYCFGEPVRAPVGGVVALAEGRIEDNKPGEPNPYGGMLGNHLVIKVGGKDASDKTAPHLFIGFLKQNSLKFKLGDTVKQGDIIGACGNSGGADYPRVRVHLQRGGSPLLAEGLPMRFTQYRVGTETISKGMPTGSKEPGDLKRGQSVTPLTPTVR